MALQISTFGLKAFEIVGEIVARTPTSNKEGIDQLRKSPTQNKRSTPKVCTGPGTST